MANGTFEIQVGIDDGRERPGDGNMNLTATQIDVGQNKLAGLRFTGLAIPQGATITSAKLRLFVKERATRTISITYSAEDEDDSPVFTTTDFDFANRTKTSATLDDTPANWTDEAYNDSPDIMAIIQEVVDRTGWTSGNALSIFIADDGSGDFRGFASFENTTPSSVPQFVVTFLVPAPTTTGGAKLVTLFLQ